MLIEFFGMPGAGKSTIVKALAGDCGARTRHQLSAEWRRLPAHKKAGYVKRSLATVDRSLAATQTIFKCGLWNMGSLARLVRVLAKTDWIGSQRELVMLDQGFLQDVWSILYMGGATDPNPASLSPFLRALYSGVDARIIYIEAAPAVALERIMGRPDGHSRLDALPETDLRKSLERVAQLPQRIVAAAAGAGIDVRRIDGSAPLGTVLQEAKSMVRV